MAQIGVGNRFVGGPDYRPLKDTTVPAFIAGVQVAKEKLGGDPQGWNVREVGDGNLNLVFIVKGPAGGLVVKQALPYVRLVGESWPLPLDRAHFEHEALKSQTAVVPHLVPKIYHFDAAMAAIVMELLEPHIVLRKGLIEGRHYPRVAADIAEFAAKTLFSTSDFAVPAAVKKAGMALFCHNTELCKITEDLVFTDPYRIAELNRWTSPQLDAVAAEFRADADLKIAVQELKWLFLSQAEALLHGDLHTGSIMVTPTETRVIDPEFAFYGPIGFDAGAFMANLLLAYFAQAGQATPVDNREACKVTILDTLEAFWTGFEANFLTLWRAQPSGDAFPESLFTDPAGQHALDLFRQRTMQRIFRDAVGFTGAKMARRILGLAHVADLESIADPDRRAACETKALQLARTLMVSRATFSSVDQVRSLAESICRRREQHCAIAC